MSDKMKTSMPAEGQNPLGIAFVGVAHAVGLGLSVGLQYAGLESKAAGLLPSVDKQVAQLGIIAATSICSGLLAGKVNKARIDYNVPWPFMMLNKGDKNAVEYNAVQRAHGNFLEAAFMMVPMILVAAELCNKPVSVFIMSQLWCWGKLGMSLSYASQQDTATRFQVWGLSYLPYFVIHGFIYHALLGKFGVNV